MNQNEGREKSRRDFLKDGMRAALLSGFVLTGFFLGGRGWNSQEIGSSCTVDLPCRSCADLRKCRKPEAEEARLQKEDLK